MADANRHSPFDERAAEEELEQIRASLEEWRRRRNQAAETFDAFVRSFAPLGGEPRPIDLRGGERRTFQTPTQPPDLPPVAAPPPRLPSAATASEGASGIVPPASPIFPARDAQPLELDRVERPPAAESLRSEPPRFIPLHAIWLRVAPHVRSLDRKQIIVAAGVLVLGVALIAWLAGRGRSEEAPSASAPAAATVPAAPSTQPAAPPARAPSPGGFQVELTTTRLVWLRVIVDGERTVEREVPAAERVTFNPKENVIIRAGDAGAVRVTINGQDVGPFGTDGFPNTRVFRRPQ